MTKKHFDVAPRIDSLELYTEEYKKLIKKHTKLMMPGKPQGKYKRLLVAVVPVIDARIRLLAGYKQITISALLNHLILNSLSLEDAEREAFGDDVIF